jgi:hypothetical protein
MPRKYVKHIHAKVDEDMYEKAKRLAELCCEGRISQLVRKLIEKEYEQVFKT